MGAFLIGFVYEIKPGGAPSVTLTRSGDTSVVVEQRPTGSPDLESADSATTQKVDLPTGAGGSSAPPVGPADIEALKALGMVIPVAGVAAKDLVDSFDDMRGGTRHHNALDIMAARNTPVIAATGGKVLKLHASAAGGLTIYIADPTSKFVMMYGHLDSFRPGLAEGQSVKRGEIIGFVGSTGNANPLAPHLHFQVTRNDNLKEWWKGTPLNPFPVFRPR
ncbi:MAG: M23 family metallopeptidase [Gemmatimonadales bacterium]